jgi:GTP-binding protein
MGVGLGHSFLRHIQRTRVLVHLLDGAGADPLADYNQINVELALYDDKLGEKPQIVVFNKMDLPQAQARWPEIEAELKKRGATPLAISAATQQNVQTLVQELVRVVDSLPEQEIRLVSEEATVYALPEDDVPFEITRGDDASYHVTGKRIERAAAMTYWDYDEAIARFQTILEALGVTKALEEAGVEVGDTVYVGDFELEWTE